MVSLIQVFEIVLVLLLSTAIVASIPKFRELVNGKAKILLYLVLGLILFTLVGIGYNVIQDIHVSELMANAIANDPAADTSIIGKDAVSILWPYVQFFPLFIMSIALAGVVLVTYMEGELYGYIFAGTGFATLLPDALRYMGNGRYDLLLLGFALWAIIPVVWVFFYKEISRETPTLRERAWGAIKASIFSYPVYVATAAVAVFGESPRMISQSMFAGLGAISGDIGTFILLSLWFYLLLTVIIVSIMFVIHDLLMHVFNVRRTVTNKGIKYEIVHPIAEIIAQEEPKIDAYKGLIEEMEVFYKYMDRVDRLRAASTIARFKSEYNTIAARHDEGSKAEAERLIKLVDQEFKKKY
ncbi:hypothetical protein [Methanocella arvoryzae]|uniref:Uncharacterized protein n=1 Tax=Methanocella arvoryzae (strain DSM 22066 / NBRC 105507 / MRE50) TaxID=351160 RepID=Q0W1J6_METAR|nr:hypothetical protein [Methanocella arvoryzae]CAJ37747.1 hypothetical protein RCIX2706 [Methanocella arvoryzae MRE50]